MKKVFLLLLVLTIPIFCVEKSDSFAVDKWFISKSIDVPKFAYGEENHSERIKMALSEKADFKNLWVEKEDDFYKKIESSKGEISLQSSDKDRVFIVFTYLNAEKWTRVNFTIKHNIPLDLFFDGEKKVEKAEVKENDETSSELVLTRGVHRVAISLFVKAGAKPTFKAFLRKVDDLPLCNVTLNCKHPLSWDDVLEAPFVVDTEISPDGKLGAIVSSFNDLKEDKRVTTLQLRNLDKGELLFDSGPFKGISSPTFDSRGTLLAYLVNSSEKGKKDLWILNLTTMKNEVILKQVEDPKSLKFSKDGTKLFFISAAGKKQPDKKSFDHIKEMYQRWGDWDKRPHLFVLDIAKRSLSQITAGETNLIDYSLSSDGKKVALLRCVFIKERPYLKTQIYLYDLENYTSKKILDSHRWPDISEIALSPDSKTIAWMASRDDMPEGGLKPKEHNAYNLNLFLIDVDNPIPLLVTENFLPTLSSQAISVLPGRRNLWWSEKDNLIYFIATDKDRVMLYSLNPKTKEMKWVPFDDPVLSSPSLSLESKKALYFTSKLGSFWKVKVGDIETGQTKVVWFPGEDIFSRVELGLLEPFDVVARDGVVIQGWILYPPNYDKNKKCPTIVAYYGGAMPYGRAFRSELFWLAGEGYIVYIVTPRGAVGYGQDFADAHCNDWGKEAGEDIIEGTRALIKLRPSVDENRIGCFGGSYGGFMTLYLIGKCDLFKSAVDYFGISNIASYWGAGWWGFNYGDTAIANSYPWTRKDIFVDQSPLYFADKINTPLLLIHGTSDTNVPIVESDQIFTALKVLGKEVEYVRFFDEDHGINSKPSVRIASEVLMLEWFDKYLKGEKEAWDFRWKDEPKAIEEEK